MIESKHIGEWCVKIQKCIMSILKSQFYSKQRYTGHFTNIMTFIKNVMDVKDNQNVMFFLNVIQVCQRGYKVSMHVTVHR